MQSFHTLPYILTRSHGDYIIYIGWFDSILTTCSIYIYAHKVHNTQLIVISFPNDSFAFDLLVSYFDLIPFDLICTSYPVSS